MADAARESLDTRIRVFLYEHALETGAVPTAAQIAERNGLGIAAVRDSLQRLADSHLIVLDPETAEVRMANPLSAIPTNFRVETPHGSFFGNCVWDALGVVAMLGGEGTVLTSCPESEEPLSLEVRRGSIAPADAVVHFAVPARSWWDDIIHT